MELARRPGDFAMVSVAAGVTLDEQTRLRDARVVVGATGDRPADHYRMWDEQCSYAPGDEGIDIRSFGLGSEREVNFATVDAAPTPAMQHRRRRVEYGLSHSSELRPSFDTRAGSSHLETLRRDERRARALGRAQR